MLALRCTGVCPALCPLGNGKKPHSFQGIANDDRLLWADIIERVVAATHRPCWPLVAGSKEELTFSWCWWRGCHPTFRCLGRWQRCRRVVTYFVYFFFLLPRLWCLHVPVNVQIAHITRPLALQLHAKILRFVINENSLLTDTAIVCKS